MRRFILTLIALTALAATPNAALAWGREGHAVVAQIARSYLTPKAIKALDALLASDPDTLTAPDLEARASWADAWRKDHRETSEWHFVDIELDHPDLAAACYGFPAAPSLASTGPAKDCVVDKIDAFAAELADPATPQAERLLAYKFLVHFVGDLHQPLHAADHQDKGGNCVPVSLGGTRTVNLHSYWDTVVVDALGPDADILAARLRSQITPRQKAAWEKGDARVWAMETHQVAVKSTYTLGSKLGCSNDAAPIPLPADYADRAQTVAALQLQRAGVRLAKELNWALG